MPKISVVIPAYNLERHLKRMLLSLQAQHFSDYEVIIVDDGSEDATYEIASGFVACDKRFKVVSQENRGVSAARNNGMDLAKGEYLIFFDGDDFIPENSLKDLYDAISEADGDMVVGIMEIYNDGEYEVNKASRNLAVGKSISPQDIDFIKTWSQCNKMYRRNFLICNDIRFVDIKVAEDGHFLYQVLEKNPVICGCSSVVYHYIRRPVWTGESTASKKTDRRYLDDRQKAYAGIMHAIEPIFEGKNLEEKQVYKNALLTRFINGGIIQAFYRRIWQCEENFEPELMKAMQKYMMLADESTKNKVKKKNWDIPVGEIVAGNITDYRRYVCDDPIVSVIIAEDIGQEALAFTLKGLYHQEFPCFEVLIPGEASVFIKEELESFLNIRKIETGYDKNKAVKAARGKYIIFIDTACIFYTHAIKCMVEKMKKYQEADCVSVYIKGIKRDIDNEDNQYSYIMYLCDAVFRKRDRSRYSKADEFDNIYANKLFKKSSIENFSFSICPADDMHRLYKEKKFVKTKSAWILSIISEEQLRKRAKVRMAGLIAKVCHMKNDVMNILVAKYNDIFR